MPIFYPAASGDDGMQDIGTAAVNIAATDLFFISTIISGIRFTNVTVAQGATVLSANLKVKYINYSGVGVLSRVTVKAQAADNAAQFTTASNNIGSRATTTASVAGSTIPDNAAVQTVGVDVTALVQEVINRPGWTSGNALAILIIGNGVSGGNYVEFYSWDYFSGNQKAELEISIGVNSSATITGTSSLTFAPTYNLVLSATLSGTSSIVASITGTFSSGATINGTSTVTASGVIYIPNEELDRKYFTYKIYSSVGTYLGEWNDVITEFTYTQEVNTAGFNLEFELAQTADALAVSPANLATQVPVDITTEGVIEIAAFSESTNSFGSGSLVAVRNRVDVYVAYGQIDTLTTQSNVDIESQSLSGLDIHIGSPNGRKIFTGFISGYTPRYGANKTTLVRVSSYGDQLNNSIVSSGSSTTVSYTDSSPSIMLKSILDQAATEGLVPTYNSVSITNSTTPASFTFKVNTLADAVQKAHELSPSDWIWFYDTAQNRVWLRDMPTVPDHTFVLGKHYTNLALDYNIDEIVNTIYFVGGELSPGVTLYKKYTDAASIAAYGPGVKVMTDDRVTLESSADLLAQNEIARYKDPMYLGKVTISASVYSIEDIKLGDLVAFKAHGNVIDTLQLRVLAEEYHAKEKTLLVGTVLPRVSRSVVELKQGLEVLSTAEVPSTPS